MTHVRSYQIADTVLCTEVEGIHLQKETGGEGILMGKAKGFLSGGHFQGLTTGVTVEREGGHRGVIFVSAGAISVVGWKSIDNWVDDTHSNCHIVQGDPDTPFPSSVKLYCDRPHPYATQLIFTETGNSVCYHTGRDRAAKTISGFLRIPEKWRDRCEIKIVFNNNTVEVDESDYSVALPVPETYGRHDVMLDIQGDLQCIGVVQRIDYLPVHDTDHEHDTHVYTDLWVEKEVPDHPEHGGTNRPEKWGETQDWSRGFIDCKCSLRAKQILIEGDGVSQPRGENDPRRGVPTVPNKLMENLSLDAVVHSVTTVYQSMYSHVLQRKYGEALNQVEVYHVANCVEARKRTFKNWWLPDPEQRRKRLDKILKDSVRNDTLDLDNVYRLADMAWPVLLKENFTPACLDSISLKSLLNPKLRGGWDHDPPTVCALLRSGAYPHFPLCSTQYFDILEARYVLACKWVSCHLTPSLNPAPLERFRMEVVPYFDKVFGIPESECIELLRDKLMIKKPVNGTTTQFEQIQKHVENGIGNIGAFSTKIEAKRAKELLISGLVKEIETEVPVSRPIQVTGTVKGKDVTRVVDCLGRSRTDVKQDVELFATFLHLTTDFGVVPQAFTFDLSREAVTVESSGVPSFVTILLVSPSSAPVIAVDCMRVTSTQVITLPPCSSPLCAVIVLVTAHPVYYKSPMVLWMRDLVYCRRSAVFSEE
eukprot:TRINITY_DN955_c6_g1_i1.p1 TRINITY_DN955_c6_g1~~TRINITY_DN955_c6_g1_i1.p1  ORF type:complete len:706 (+),score=42.97 TRINITY_DN955_c6_g1_i1:68-2185(+)